MKPWLAIVLAGLLFVPALSVAEKHVKTPKAKQHKHKHKHQKHKHGHHKKGQLNARFLSKKLDVKLWKTRFNSKKREVFQHREAIVRSLGLKAGQSVADVGAGTGIFLKPLQKAIGPKGKLTAVELSPNFVKYLKSVSSKLKVPFKVVKSTFTSTKLATNSQNVIFTCDTYHHFDKPVAMLKDFRRVLRPGGWLVIVDYDRIPGKSRPWIMNHIKHGKNKVMQQILSNGFDLVADIKLPGMKENYVLMFQLKKAAK